MIEYKKEAFNLFEDLLNRLKNQFIALLINIKIVNDPEQNQSEEISKKQNQKFNNFTSKKIGRNEPCPCNSGKKYKHCCGAL